MNLDVPTAACLNAGKVPDALLQYADVAEWQNELLESEDAKAGKDYWRKQFSAPAQGALKLPLEKENVERASFDPQVPDRRD